MLIHIQKSYLIQRSNCHTLWGDTPHLKGLPNYLNSKNNVSLTQHTYHLKQYDNTDSLAAEKINHTKTNAIYIQLRVWPKCNTKFLV